MTSEPSDYDADADPEMLASKAGGAGSGEIVHGVDGVATATPVSEDPDAEDDSDADPEMLSSTT